MMKHGVLIVLLVCFLFLDLKSQKFTLSGTINDAKSGEVLIGATVRVLELPGTGVSSNEYGFYSLTLVKGRYTLIAQYIGYAADTFYVDLSLNTQKNLRLSPEGNELEEIVITAEKEDEHLSSAQTGVEKIDMKEVNKIPVLFGEKDILKTMQLLPGIKSVGDAGGGMYVRGGAADQNLIVLDEALVYNASHLLGFFSTFNSDAIKDVAVYKGTQPVQYGGRLSSAMDIRMNDGNKQVLETNGSIGLISSKLSLEGPIVKDKGSVFVSGRRTYADLFLQMDDRYKGSTLYFYDLNAKANYRLGDKDVLYLSGYFGRDDLGLEDLFGLDWGNATGTLRWNHILNSKLFSNTSLIASNYNYKVGIERGGSDFNIRSDITDYSLKQEFQYFPGSKHTWRFGLNSIYHTILPGEVSGETTNYVALQKQYSIENGIYISDEWKPNSRVSLIAGLRLSNFVVLGRGDFYELDETHNISDTTTYASGEVVKVYNIPEPRISGSYRISANSSLKASYGRNAQYLHLVSNSTVSNPTDKWLSTNNNIQPEIADQVSLGYFSNLFKNKYESSMEVYYKAMQNQIDYKNGADVLLSGGTETQLLSGIGRAYGLEMFIKKKTGKLTGWISYTISRTERKIDGINNNDWYLARQDKTHDISIVGNYDINPRINISATWVYSTGNAVTFPTGKYYIDQQVVWFYTERNGYRMPSYHRLDLGATFKLKSHRKFSHEISVGIFNAYGRENAYSIDFRESELEPGKTEVVQTALFKFVPSVSWNFKIK